MKENELDRRTDKIKTRLNSVFSKIQSRYGKANPYRMERVPDKERLMDFAQQTPEDIEFGRQQFGDEVIDKYLTQMGNLQGRYKNA